MGVGWRREARGRLVMDFNPLMLLAGNLTSIIQGCREEGLEKCEREREVKTEREKGREGIGEGKEREKEAEMYFSECFPHGHFASCSSFKPHCNLWSRYHHPH